MSIHKQFLKEMLDAIKDFLYTDDGKRNGTFISVDRDKALKDNWDEIKELTLPKHEEDK